MNETISVVDLCTELEGTGGYEFDREFIKLINDSETLPLRQGLTTERILYTEKIYGEGVGGLQNFCSQYISQGKVSLEPLEILVYLYSGLRLGKVVLDAIFPIFSRAQGGYVLCVIENDIDENYISVRLEDYAQNGVKLIMCREVVS